jgi:hypothetical protein
MDEPPIPAPFVLGAMSWMIDKVPGVMRSPWDGFKKRRLIPA